VPEKGAPQLLWRRRYGDLEDKSVFAVPVFSAEKSDAGNRLDYPVVLTDFLSVSVLHESLSAE